MQDAVLRRINFVNTMKKQIGFLLIVVLLMVHKLTLGQSLSTEVSGMDSNWAVSGSFNTKLNKLSKFSFSSISRFSYGYTSEASSRLLCMTNFGYSISSRLKSTAGGMYTNSGGLKPSVGLQYIVVGKHITWMAFPNLNISRKSDLMTISMFQAVRDVSAKTKLVGRLQSLCLLSTKGHLFSTYRFRTGLIKGKYQFGAAADLDFYGSDFSFARNLGMFLQYQFL